MKLKHLLLTALILFLGVGGVYATKRYVGFSSGGTYSNTELQTALTDATNGKDTVCVATGLYLADAAEFTVPEGVTLIGGYNKGDITAPRQYPGQFVPFDSSVVNQNQFTILDGNAYKRSLPAQKHRVITVNAGGVVDGCLIRNGHVRNKNGGGVLLNGGKLYNSIVRGNVAMNHPDSAEALGGGVFIQKGGELINCLVAYNMANDGYGVAAGQGGGKMINNTITANTYSPVFAKIPGTPTGQPFRMYKGNASMNHRPAINGLDTIPKLAAKIELSDFYLSRILTTQGQFAVFCAAMDIPKSGNNGQLNIETLKNLQNPVKTGTIEAHYVIGIVDPALQNMLQKNTDVNWPGLNYADGVWFPVGDTSTVEYPMGIVSWYGSLAYSVWLGGGLPTEAQWEYAARRNQDGTLSENLYSGAFGSSFNASNGAASNDAADTATWRVLDTIAWVAMAVSLDTSGVGYKQEAIWGPNRPHEIARKRPNAMGIYDMTGNVREWMADRWNGSTAGEIYTSGKDPINSAASNNRAHRGGTWYFPMRKEFSLTYRDFDDKLTLSFVIGFRPVVVF